MNYTLQIAELLLTRLFSFLLLGALVAHFLADEKKFSFVFKKIVINFLFPILIFHNITHRLGPEKITETSLAMLAAVIFIPVNMLLISLEIRRLSPLIDEKTFRLGGSFHNYGFAVLPLVDGLLGPSAMPFAIAFAVICDVLFWSLGAAILKSEKMPWTNILNMPLIALAASLLLVVSGISREIPQRVHLLLRWPAAAAIPSALACIGGLFYLAIRSHKTDFSLWKRDLFRLLAFRHLFVPLLWLSLLSLLPLEPVLKTVIAIEFIMPASIGIVFLVGLFGGNLPFLAVFSLSSNAIAIFSIPLLLQLRTLLQI